MCRSIARVLNVVPAFAVVHGHSAIVDRWMILFDADGQAAPNSIARNWWSVLFHWNRRKLFCLIENSLMLLAKLFMND